MPNLPVLVVAAVLATAACAPPNAPGQGVPPTPTPSESPTSASASAAAARAGARLRDLRRSATPAGRFPSYAVDARGARVAVHDRPGGVAVRTLANPQRSGAPLVFLLDRDEGAWLRVHLPVRPNGSTGWVRRRDVVVRGVTFRIDVLRGAHELRLYEHGRLVRTFPAGIGTADTPTPGGTFYLKELLQPPDPNGLYGPYAYGLSGFSNVLTSFNGGEGVIGIHGTNDPASVGRDVSHGCVRLRNEDVSYLADRLPLGTPVRILA